MARVEFGGIIDRLNILTHRKGELVIYRENGRWDGLPVAGTVVGRSFGERTIDVNTGRGIVVELTPKMFDKFGDELRPVGLDRSYIDHRLIFPPSAGEPPNDIIYRIPASWII